MGEKPLIGITLGDPSGIGPEIVVKTLQKPFIHQLMRPFVIGTVHSLDLALKEAGINVATKKVFNPKEVQGLSKVLEVISPGDYESTVFPRGMHSALSGEASHTWVESATDMCENGSIDAMVTAPINKESWQIAGREDLGHQEVFKRKTKSDTVYTMLISGSLRCMHLSTHKPLLEACRFVTTANVLTAIKTTHKSFEDWGVKSPRIAVAALNPHASDNGLIGDTENTEIRPAIESAVKENINATGPHPADSVFNQAIHGQYDVVIVMYHDQGHIAIKVHGLEQSISVNLGIPFIRTSVDHGTAFDIVGKNLADETSMVEAALMASKLASREGIT